MFPLLWDGVGEDIIITESTVDFAMGDIQGGIVAGWHDGIGKRVSLN